MQTSSNYKPRPMPPVVGHVDPETGVVIGVSGIAGDATYTEGGLVKHGVIICDRRGNEAEIVDGAVRVVDCSGDPVHTDVTGGDTYDVWTAIITAPHELHYIHASATTQDAQLSLGGGVPTFHLTKGVPATFPGLRIRKGQVIYARNADAAANFGALFFTAW